MQRNITFIPERFRSGVLKEELREYLNSELPGRYRIKLRGRKIIGIRMVSGLDIENENVKKIKYNSFKCGAFSDEKFNCCL